MEPEPPERVSIDPDGEPASTTAVGVASAREVYPDVIAVEGHPVDAALT
jgi:hypothetical protein